MSKQASNFQKKAMRPMYRGKEIFKPVNEVYRFKTDGFHGELFRPERDNYPGKALICFSGSDGRFEWTRMLAQVFQAHGLTALALAYVE